MPRNLPPSLGALCVCCDAPAAFLNGGGIVSSEPFGFMDFQSYVWLVEPRDRLRQGYLCGRCVEAQAKAERLELFALGEHAPSEGPISEAALRALFLIGARQATRDLSQETDVELDESPCMQPREHLRIAPLIYQLCGDAIWLTRRISDDRGGLHALRVGRTYVVVVRAYGRTITEDQLAILAQYWAAERFRANKAHHAAFSNGR